MEIFEKAFNWLADLSAKLPTINFKAYFIVVLAVLLGMGIIVALSYLGSRSSKLTRASKKIKKYLDCVDVINDDNAGDFTEQCFSQRAPQPLRDSWVQYLGVRFGYPSDIVSDKNVYDKIVKKNKDYRSGIYLVISLILLGAFAFWGYGTLDTISMSVVHLLGLVVIGVVYLVLIIIHRKQTKHCLEIFDNMQEDLDAKVNLQVEKNFATDSSPLFELVGMAEEIIARNSSKEVELEEADVIEPTPIETLIELEEQSVAVLEEVAPIEQEVEAEEIEEVVPEQIEEPIQAIEEVEQQEIVEEIEEPVQEQEAEIIDNLEDEVQEEIEEEPVQEIQEVEEVEECQEPQEIEEPIQEETADEYIEPIEEPVEEEIVDETIEEPVDTQEVEESEYAEDGAEEEIEEAQGEEVPFDEATSDVQDEVQEEIDEDVEEDVVEEDIDESDVQEDENQEENQSSEEDDEDIEEEQEEGDEQSEENADEEPEVVYVVDGDEDEEAHVKPAKLVKLPNLVDYMLTKNMSKAMKMQVAGLLISTYKKFEHSKEDRKIVVHCLTKVMQSLQQG